MKLHRRKRLHVLVPIATMGDIAFLLIIFFILATVMREAKIEVEPAASRDVEKQEMEPLSIIIDTEGVVYLQGEEVGVASLQTLLEAQLANRAENIVTVRIDKSIEFEQFKPVLMAVSKAGGVPNLTGDLIKQ